MYGWAEVENAEHTGESIFKRSLLALGVELTSYRRKARDKAVTVTV